jgi:small GTP-binding protein
MLDRQADLLIKIVLIGDSGVGKTNMLRRYTKKEFGNDTRATIGVDFQATEFRYKDKLIKVQFWDTAGQEKYQAITASYYKQAHGAIVVYDVTQQKSFEHIPYWQKELRKSIGERTKLMIIGNKCDLPRVVDRELAARFAEEQGCLFHESSAKDDLNIRPAFEDFFQRILDEQFTFLSKRSQNYFGAN